MLADSPLTGLCPLLALANDNFFKVYLMWGVGLGLSAAIYLIVALHFFTYITVIAPLLKKRFGTELGLIWTVVGLVLVYNIVYNHFLAMMIKPGSVKDLKMTEEMRSA